MRLAIVEKRFAIRNDGISERGELMRSNLTRLLLVAAFAAAIGLIGVLAGKDSTRATSFNPTGGFAVDNPTAGANSDIVVELDIGAPDSLFSGVISFIPPAWGLADCPVGQPESATPECADGEIPDGAMVGVVESDTVLGLLNSACNNQLDLTFELMDATTDMSEQVVFHDTDDNDTGEQFEDDDGNGIPNGAEMYPDYLTRLIRDQAFNPADPDASAPLQPIARLYSQLRISSDVDNTSVQFLVLQPGGTINGVPLDPRLGYPVVLVLNNLGDPGLVAQPGPVTSFCSPLSSVSTTFGMTQDNPDTDADESGLTYLTNPGEGTYPMVLFLASEADADGDGIENPLDSCPTQGNSPGWDPRDPGTPGDNDMDGIPNICDVTPDQNTGASDHDGDGFLNNADNCPLLVNADQLDFDRDDIGNLCDPDPGATTGHQHVACIVEEITIGAAPAGDGEPFDPLAAFPCALDTPIAFGDVDCNGEIEATDALSLLRFVANFQPAAICIDAGDVNCDGDKDVVDALQILLFIAGLEVNQPQGCPPIGTLV